MSRSDLRALFRSNDRNLKAVDVFANRDSEWAAVTRSIACRVEANSDPSFDVEDLEAPRENVLTFYGVGGIGKTTLSHQLVERLSGGDRGPSHWPVLKPGLGPIVPVRIDLSSQAGVDLETIMLSLRVAVAQLGRPMPAFDLALHRYWEHNHPGEALGNYLRRSSFFSRISSAVSVSGQVEEVLADVAQALLLPGSVGLLVGQTLKAVVGGLRDRHRRLKLIGACGRLPDLLEADPDVDALSYYAHLLAWDLAQLPPGDTATLVVLLDTFEDVGDRTHRDVERLIQRVVWLMPNVLFVVTGRNRLQWDDEHLEGQLDWVGSRSWPLLAAPAQDDPRQHRVGYLSPEDSEGYLSRRLTVDEQPLMSKRVREVIIGRSHGLPLYLDLAVMRFLDLHQQFGQAPNPEEFNHDFPALVARTFRDLTLAERHVLRAVSLLDAFSISLAAAITEGLAHESAARALVERPFIDYEPAALWPYYLHSLVRSAIRDADSTSEDRWSDSDWRRTAGRTLVALGQELQSAKEMHDRPKTVACLRQGLRLVSDFGLELSWLVDAAFYYVEDYVWEPIDVPEANASGLSTRQSERSRAAVALATALNAIAHAQREHRSQALAAMTSVFESGDLPDSLIELPLYFMARWNRDLGNLEEAMAGLREAAAKGGRLAPDARRGLLTVAKRLGQFPEILNGAAALGREGRKDRTLGNLWWTQGAMVRACDAYARERDAALRLDHDGEAAISQAGLAFAASFQDADRAEEQIDRAHELLARTNEMWSHHQVISAEILRDAGLDHSVPGRVAELVQAADRFGLTSLIAYTRFVLCFHAAALDDAELLEEARSELKRSVNGREFAYLLEASYFLVQEVVPDEIPRSAWIDGPETTGMRWHQLVQDRRVQIAGSH